MSFQQVIKLNQRLAGPDAQLKNALTKPSYSQNPDQVYDNMDQDPLIPPMSSGVPNGLASREDLLGALAPSVSKQIISKFCETHVHKGPIVQTQTLGRVQSRYGILNGLTSPPSSMGQKDAEALIQDLVVLGPDLAKQKAAFAIYNLAPKGMWSYPPSDPTDPFCDIGHTRADAVNILGLGYYEDVKPTAELVRFAHKLPSSITAHQPTAWDASVDTENVYWRTGGKTFKLDQTGYGLAEVVHKHVQGEHLVVPIEPMS